MKKFVYVVGIYKGDDCQWEVYGIFDNYTTALEKATKHNYFIGEVCLNSAFGDDPFYWENSFYPQEKSKEDIKLLVSRFEGFMKSDE